MLHNIDTKGVDLTPVNTLVFAVQGPHKKGPPTTIDHAYLIHYALVYKAHKVSKICNFQCSLAHIDILAYLGF